VKTFISALDIENLAAQGVRELTVDEDTVLTAVAREAAARLGVKLVAPGSPAAAAPVRPAAAAAVAGSANPAKPKGCQHGPLTAGASSAPAAAPHAVSAGGPVVDELIGAVKRLARK
jgi:hypothetical protein